MIVNTPVRLQSTPVDCGAACLGIVLEYHGQAHSSLDLRRLCAVGRDGATVAQIQRGTEVLGHKCRILKKGIESLKKTQMPMILHWDLRHFVVLEGFSGDRVMINDPASGRRKLSLEEFERHFTGVCLEVTVQDQAKPDKVGGPSLAELHALAPDGPKYLGAALAVGVAAAFLVFFIELAFGGVARAFFDYVVSYHMVWWGYILGIVGIPVLAIRFGLRYLQTLRLESQSLESTLKIKRAFLDRLYARPTVFFDAHFAGELFGRLKDLDQCLRLSLRAHHTIVPQGVIAVSTTIALLLIAPLIAIIQIVPRLMIIGWMYVESNRTHELELKIRDEGDRNRALQTQRAGGFLRFYAAGLQDHLLATCLPGIGRWQAARTNYERRFITFRAIQRAVDTSSQPLAAFVGSYLMIAGQMTYGGFMLATALGIVLTAQLTEMSDTFQKYRTLGPVVRRVAEVVEQAERDEGLAENQIVLPVPPAGASGSAILTADRLSFGYNGLDADLFSNLSFSIARREVINIRGESGAGKSTLLDLLAGLRRPIGGGLYFEGSVVDGPINAGFVVADDEFIEGSLTNFIANGREFDSARVTYVLRFVELWDRLGFFVGGDGTERLEKQGLSRGEIQRLMLAQAIYRSGECLIFDEAFTHLSLDQSVRILQRLRELGTTVIMATHRPEIQALCDRTISLTPQANGPTAVENIPAGAHSRPHSNGERFQ